jgi:hypothetical protein
MYLPLATAVLPVLNSSFARSKRDACEAVQEQKGDGLFRVPPSKAKGALYSSALSPLEVG